MQRQAQHRARERDLDNTLYAPTAPHRPLNSANTQINPAYTSHPTSPVSREGFTIAIQNMLAAPERESQVHITGAHVLLALLLVVIFVVRISNLRFNTLYLDEAIYTTVGEDVLTGVFKQGATQWMFGSYLYPIAATLADRVGGEVGLRALSAVLSTAAAVFVYLAARRLFGRESALWALLLFGLSGASINLGQHAVYDAMGVPFLAIALYCAVSAIRNPEKQRRYLTLAGIAFSLSVLAKYIALVTLPALLMVMLAFHLFQGRGLFSFFTRVSWTSLFGPILIILGIYAAFYRQDLQMALSGQFASQHENWAVILGEIIQEIGVPLLFACIGLVIGAASAIVRLRGTHVGVLLLLGLVLPWLLFSILALPLYHLATSNVRALWKHDVYTLVFLAPLAGYGIKKSLELVRSIFQWRSLRAISALVTAAAIFWFVSSNLGQNTGFHTSWPNTAAEMQYMRQYVTPQSRILASAYAIYEYYFDFGVNDRGVWNNVWYTEYEGLTGTEAVAKAVQDCAFDMVVLDNYYAPEWSGTLQSMLDDAGYVVAYTTSQTLSTGVEIITYVNLPFNSGQCQGRFTQ